MCISGDKKYIHQAEDSHHFMVWRIRSPLIGDFLFIYHSSDHSITIYIHRQRTYLRNMTSLCDPIFVELHFSCQLSQSMIIRLILHRMKTKDILEGLSFQHFCKVTTVSPLLHSYKLGFDLSPKTCLSIIMVLFQKLAVKPLDSSLPGSGLILLLALVGLSCQEAVSFSNWLFPCPCGFIQTFVSSPLRRK